MKCPLFKKISLLFDKRKQNLFVDLDNDLYEVYIKNHEPINHNKISNYEKWLDRLGNELGGKKT